MDRRHPVVLLAMACLFASCQQDATGVGDDRHAVAARIEAGGVPLDTWKSTDAVQLMCRSTAGDVLMDTVIPLGGRTGVLRLTALSVRNDLGVTISVAGYASGVKIWTGTVAMAACSSDTTLVVKATMADTVTGGTAPAGALNAPGIAPFSVSRGSRWDPLLRKRVVARGGASLASPSPDGARDIAEARPSWSAART